MRTLFPPPNESHVEVLWKMNENTLALDDGGAQGPGAPLLAHPSYTQAASEGPSQDAWAPWS